MLKAMKKRIGGKKGFTLIELIVVIAILGIIAMIAVPRFAAMRVDSMVTSDAQTARSIINAARIQETNTNETVTVLNGVAAAGVRPLTDATLSAAVPQSGGAFALGRTAAGLYQVTWTPAAQNAPRNVGQTVTENAAFVIQ